MKIFLKKINVIVFLGAVLSVAMLMQSKSIAKAAYNPVINYQGKLTDSNYLAVPDGDYNMEFKLYDASSGGTLLWTETHTGADKIHVANGLFNVMLGEVASFSGFDFNQSLYLTVNIGGTGSPSWDGEMSPRKKIGAVPAAFVASNLEGTGLIDIVNTASPQLSLGYDSSNKLSVSVASNGAATLNLAGASAGLNFTGGNVGIGAANPVDPLSIGVSINQSSTHALLNLSNTALSGASAQGTYIGLNPTSFSGDFFNFQIGGVSKATLDSTGLLTVSGCTGCGSGGAVSLDQLLAATGANSINNGDNNQVWNWHLTTDNGAGLALGESSASTGANTALLQLSTLTSSTAIPIKIENAGDGYFAQFLDGNGIEQYRVNSGGTVFANGFIAKQMQFSEEFIRFRASVTADVAGGGTTGLGDTFAWGAGELGTCTWSILSTETNGIQRQATGATGSGCLTYTSRGSATRLDLLNAAYNPIIVMKLRPSVVGTNNWVMSGMMDYTDGSTALPTNGVYFSNEGGSTWTAVARSGGTQTAVSCTGQTINTTQYAYMRIKMSASSINFYIDSDTSDGIDPQFCATITTSIPSGNYAAEVMNEARTGGTAAMSLDLDFIRMNQDDPIVDQSAQTLQSLTQDGTVDTNGNALQIGTDPIDGLSVNSVLPDSTGPSGQTSQGLSFGQMGSLQDALNISQDVIFFGRPYFNNDTAGFAVIKKGTKSVEVTFDSPYLQLPVLSAVLSFDKDTDADGSQAASVLDENVSYAVAKNSKTGFIILLNKPAPADLKFSWVALAVKDAKIFLDDSTNSNEQNSPAVDTAIDDQPVTDPPADNQVTDQESTVPPPVEPQPTELQPVDTQPVNSPPADAVTPSLP